MKDNQKFIIAIMILASIIVILLISFLSLSFYNKPMSAEGHKTVSQIVTSLIAIVSVIVGHQVNNK
jgi:hypothetical protein